MDQLTLGARVCVSYCPQAEHTAPAPHQRCCKRLLQLLAGGQRQFARVRVGNAAVLGDPGVIGSFL